MKLASSRRKRKQARTEIIPLIDIMFFLLATFVMVSTAMIKNRGIAVQLPVAESGAQEERKDFVSITVTDTGEYFLDKSKVSLPELSAGLTTLKSGNIDPRVFINGDKNANLGALVSALDEVRKAGIAKVALETTSKQ